MLARVVSLATLLALLPSCHPSALYLIGCLAVTERATCRFPVTNPATAPLQLGGTIDAAYAGEYRCTALVEGHNLGAPMTLYQAEIQVLDPAQNNAVITEFSVPITGSVDPGTGFGTTELTALDAATLQAEAKSVAASGRVQTVVSHFALRGRDPGGSEIDTSWLDYPIDVYVGSTCTKSPEQLCVGVAAEPDCRIGIDDAPNCATIASALGPCGTLECDIDPMTGQTALASAHCARHAPPDNSCCP
jgi:hypothetical protein